MFIAISLIGYGQRKVRVEHADFSEGGRMDGKRYFKVVGNVHFIQETMEIWCDSAFLYKNDNSLEAFGHIRVFDMLDSTTITSRRLIYNGNSQYANLRENVIYREDSIILYTDYLDYDIISKSANYFNGGKLHDGDNILTSRKGYYDARGRAMAFKTEVVLVNPESTLETDSLYYDMITKVASSVGPTKIISSDGTTVNTEKGGEFRMRVNKTTINAGIIETESYILRGDQLFYDRNSGSNRAIGNVYMFSKDNDIIITGEEAENDGERGITKIFGNPLLKKVFEEDTLYLRADTLISIDDSLDVNKKLLAYHNVVFFRYDLQGISDSLSYFLSDSILFLYNDPVIWNMGNQIEADSINIVFRNNQINTLNLIDNSFMILQDTLKNFNQLKGKTMTGFFAENQIASLNVDGNSESIFFALDDEDNSLTGLNKILCSSMVIRFVDNKADNMSFYMKPEASFIPPHEIEEPDTRLKGFNWREEERPKLADVLSKEWSVEKAPDTSTKENEDAVIISDSN